MELGLNIVFWFFTAVCLSTIIVAIFLTLGKKYRLKSATDRNEKNTSRIIQAFLPEESNNTGHNFIRLIELGFFATPKTDNHSKTFDDKKHLINFRKNLTSENSVALRKIGANYG